MPTTILGIESSCDETSAAICVDGHVMSNVVASQGIHTSYGGIVPELAARAHQKNIIPVVEQAILNANISKNHIDAVAFTRGPGLLGSLLVGVSFAKAFALTKNLPLIEVNHIQAHVLTQDPLPKFPFLCLMVSGGHTQIVLVKDYFVMQVLGQTQDDAVGEMLDKAGIILGMSYPGGPAIDRHARQGNPHAYQFPEPQVPGFDFSFSGLKTAILYFVRDRVAKDPDFLDKHRADLCASVESHISTILLNKLKKAAAKHDIREIALAGGVAANVGLRDNLRQTAKELGWNCHIPKLNYCTDNAAMVAMVGYYKFLKKCFANQSLTPAPRMPL